MGTPGDASAEESLAIISPHKAGQGSLAYPICLAPYHGRGDGKKRVTAHRTDGWSGGWGSPTRRVQTMNLPCGSDFRENSLWMPQSGAKIDRRVM